MPWRLTPFGLLGESVVILALVVLAIGGLLALRARGGPGLSDEEQTVAQLQRSTPTRAATFTPKPPPSPTLPPNTPVPPSPTPEPSVITYTVVSGDTMIGIASQFDASVDQILGANQDSLESVDSLHIGQQLRIPIQRQAEPPVAEAPADAPAEGEPGEEPPPPGEEPAEVSGGDPPVDGPAEVASRQALQPDLAVRLGLPADGRSDQPSTRWAPAQSVPGEQKAADAILTERVAAEAFPAPQPVVPGDGATLTSQSPLLRWTSVGILPPGAYYVVAIQPADADEDGEPRLLWVLSNSTAVRVPGDLRPPLGTSREIEWSLAVRRRAGARLLGNGGGEMLSSPSAVRTFTWSP